MKILLTLALLSVARCQTSGVSLNPSLQPPFAYPGSTTQLSLVYADSNPPSQLAAISWIVNLPTGVTAGTPVPAAGVNLQCQTPTIPANPSNTNCNATSSLPFLNGPIVTQTLTAAPSLFGSFPVSITVSTATTPVSTSPINLNVAASTGTTPWFSVVSGKTTCRVSKVAQIPLRVSYVCFNIYGATAGSYTADVNGGLLGGNTFLIGLNSLGTDSAFCTITLNSTSQAITLTNSFPAQTVLPYSGIYMCGANSTTGPGSVGWP